MAQAQVRLPYACGGEPFEDVRLDDGTTSLPYACGGEPYQGIPLMDLGDVYPTHVGVNRSSSRYPRRCPKSTLRMWG